MPEILQKIGKKRMRTVIKSGVDAINKARESDAARFHPGKTDPEELLDAVRSYMADDPWYQPADEAGIRAIAIAYYKSEMDYL